MKRINILFLALVAIFAVSCGEPEPKEIILTVKSTTIRGDLGKYFKVADKPVKVTAPKTYSPKDFMIQIELEKIAELPYDPSTTYPVGTSGEGVDCNIGFGIKVFDADDNISLQIAPTAVGFQGVYSHEDIKNLITMEVGESGIVRWSETLEEDVQDAIATFEITSAAQVHKPSKNSKTASKASSGNSKWDSILTQYEEYIDSYISLLRKANSGDMSAMADAVELLESAEDLCEDLSDAESQMSSAQRSRLMRITNKMTNAAMSF